MPNELDKALRAKALAGFDILDTPPEPAFDDLALLASEVCGTPMALITLIDEDRQWFKARVGFEATETGLARSICIHAVADPGLTVIRDLRLDPRTDANPSVSGAPDLRFYAGAPLVTAEGQSIGSLCVLDTEPRPDGLQSHQAATIEVLARQVMAQLELRRAVKDLATRTETLRAQEGRLRTVFETIYQFQGLLTRDGRLLDANAVSLKAIARTLDEVAGQPYWDTPWFSGTPGMRERVRGWIEQVAAGRDVREEFSLELLGQTRTFDFAMRPVRAPDGTVVGMVPGAVDVTERRAAEAQLRQAQKMEAVGQLTGGLAHDFNNMLAVIVGSLDLLDRRLAKGDTDVARYIDAALDGANRAAALTHRLLAFSRQQPLAPVPVDANRMVAGMSDLLTRSLGEAVQIETVLSAGLWKAHADPSQLENVILNLCVNARDAMPEGGRLTVETNNARIDDAYGRENAVEPGQYVLIAVSDTGTGMSPAVMAKAFDPFFTTKEVGKGTGLGLSQVFGFVRQSNGHVKIYSEPDRGTTLKIYLPRFHGAEGAPPEPEATTVPRAGCAETILVVEDDERMRACSVESLRELGYDVVEAGGGAEALRLIAAGQSVTLLFTDIVMPEMTGRELAERLLALRPNLKVLYTTGYTRNAVVHNGVLDTGTHLLPKPFGIAQLAEKVRMVLDR